MSNRNHYWTGRRASKYTHTVVYRSGNDPIKVISRHETPERAREVADKLNKQLLKANPGNQRNSNTRLLCGYEVLGG